jgi:hypothetical protein
MYISEIELGVLDYFNKQINRWHPTLKGILANYGKIRLKSPNGQLLNEEPHIHVDVISDFWVFRPKIGSILQGIVTKTSPRHVACKVHGVFNVPCYHPYNIGPNVWWGMNAKIGSLVRFRIIKMDVSQKIPFFQGDLEKEGLDESNEDVLKTELQVEKVDEIEWQKDLELTHREATISKDGMETVLAQESIDAVLIKEAENAIEKVNHNKTKLKKNTKRKATVIKNGETQSKPINGVTSGKCDETVKVTKIQKKRLNPEDTPTLNGTEKPLSENQEQDKERSNEGWLATSLSVETPSTEKQTKRIDQHLSRMGVPLVGMVPIVSDGTPIQNEIEAPFSEKKKKKKDKKHSNPEQSMEVQISSSKKKIKIEKRASLSPLEQDKHSNEDWLATSINVETPSTETQKKRIDPDGTAIQNGIGTPISKRKKKKKDKHSDQDPSKEGQTSTKKLLKYCLLKT